MPLVNQPANIEAVPGAIRPMHAARSKTIRQTVKCENLVIVRIRRLSNFISYYHITSSFPTNELPVRSPETCHVRSGTARVRDDMGDGQRLGPHPPPDTAQRGSSKVLILRFHTGSPLCLLYTL
jgi:hypothetical protein